MAPRLLILAVLFFVAATAVYTFPLARHPGSLLLAGVGDHPSEAALIGWTARQLLHAPGHLFDTEFFYPHSHTEAYWQSVLVPGILAMPVMAATGDALLATNTVVLLALVLSGLLTAGLASSLTHRAIPSLLAGAVFAFFPNRLEHLNSPMVQMGFLLPAILWAYIRFLEEARWRHLLVLVLALWGQIFSSLYYAFAAGFLLLAIGLGWLLLRPDTMSWRLVARGALGVGGLALAAGPFLAPYLSVHRALGFERDEGLADWFGMDLLSWLDPGAFSTLYGNRFLSLGHSEGGLFPGFVLLALVAAALVWASTVGRGSEADALGDPRASRRPAGRHLLPAGHCAGDAQEWGHRASGRRQDPGSRPDGTSQRAPAPRLGWTAIEGRRRSPARCRRASGSSSSGRRRSGCIS